MQKYIAFYIDKANLNCYTKENKAILNCQIRRESNHMRDKLNLRKLRESNKMTQEQLAQEVGVTRQYIGMLESQPDEVSPSVDVAKKLGRALGFNWTKFYGEETEIEN